MYDVDLSRLDKSDKSIIDFLFMKNLTIKTIINVAKF